MTAAAMDLSSLAAMRIMGALRVSLRWLSLVVMGSVGRVERVCGWVGGGRRRMLTRAFRAVVLTWTVG